MPGTLYIVATPIGNLEDITLRALRILREADVIACEDTRQTRKLLDHYGVATPTVSYHEHNETVRTPELIERLRAGARVALVSDAGTPLVSDPGYRLVAAAVENAIPVESVPGPSAAIAALAAAGLPSDAFYFAGFLPARSTQRKKALARLKDIPATLIFYEAPHRILDTLAEIEEVLGERPVVLGREITKIHEEYLRGTPAELRKTRIPLKGEFTVLVGRAAGPAAGAEVTLTEAVEAHLRSGLSRMEAIKAVARERGLAKGDVYREVEDLGRRA